MYIRIEHFLRMTDFFFCLLMKSAVDRRYANCIFVDKCGPQVSLLSRVTPRYLTVDFHGMGSLSNYRGSVVKLRRRLNMIAVLFNALIKIFQFLHHVDSYLIHLSGLAGYVLALLYNGIHYIHSCIVCKKDNIGTW